MSARHVILLSWCGCSSVEALPCEPLEGAGGAAVTQSLALPGAWPGHTPPAPAPQNHLKQEPTGTGRTDKPFILLWTARSPGCGLWPGGPHTGSSVGVVAAGAPL